MEKGPRIVIACGCMKPELEAMRSSGSGVEARYLDQNLHRTPDRMAELIQEEIDAVAEGASEIVLGYGLCSNGIVGVKAPPQGLIIPRVHDCVALFLGSREAYNRAFSRRAGSYYLTPGWVQSNRDPLGLLEHDYEPRVGREDAEWALREELKHYTHIVYINTSVGDRDSLRKRAVENAEYLEKQYEEVAGTGDYFKKLLFGPYNDEDFVKIPPGEEVTADPFMNR